MDFQNVWCIKNEDKKVLTKDYDVKRDRKKFLRDNRMSSIQNNL